MRSAEPATHLRARDHRAPSCIACQVDESLLSASAERGRATAFVLLRLPIAVIDRRESVHQFAGGSLAGNDCSPHSSTTSKGWGGGAVASGWIGRGTTSFVRLAIVVSRNVISVLLERVRGTLSSPVNGKVSTRMLRIAPGF